MSKYLPKASAEATRDASVVLAIHPTAQAFYDRANNKVHVSLEIVNTSGRDNIELYYTQLGFGSSAESAWADAARNVSRKPIPELPNRGSSTWSLKSDEVFWKDAKEPQSVPPVAPSQSSGADNNARNEGQADLSKLKM